jgi:hypothetical protein
MLPDRHHSAQGDRKGRRFRSIEIRRHAGKCDLIELCG